MAELLFPAGGPEVWRARVKEQVAEEALKVRLDPYRPVPGKPVRVPLQLWPEWKARYGVVVEEVRWEEEDGMVVRGRRVRDE